MVTLTFFAYDEAVFCKQLDSGSTDYPDFFCRVASLRTLYKPMPIGKSAYS